MLSPDEQMWMVERRAADIELQVASGRVKIVRFHRGIVHSLSHRES